MRNISQRKIRKTLSGYAFLAPSAVLLLAFTLIPIICTFGFSFTEYTGMRDPEWIGIGNYIKAFRDRDVRAALKNTFIFTVVSIPLQVIPSLAIAALIAHKYPNRFGAFVRSSTYIPVLCSSVVVGTIFYYLFSSDRYGLVNLFLSLFGIESVNWLGSSDTALGVIIFIYAWQKFGYWLVIFYAGIMDVPRGLYEAAELDGANAWHQFLYITVPGVKNVTTMVITMCMINSFQFFDLAFTMTGGGPGNATTSLANEIYINAFQGFNFGYGSALSVILFILILFIHLLKSCLIKEGD